MDSDAAETPLMDRPPSNVNETKADKWTTSFEYIAVPFLYSESQILCGAAHATNPISIAETWIFR
jgi:hypothetical protein